MNMYEEFKEKMRKLSDINHSIAVLSWDKEVNLPKDSAPFRSQQIATLSGISHDLFTDPAFGELLENLNNDSSLNAKEKKNVSVTLKDYKQSTKFSSEFVIRMSNLVSQAYHAWLKAREENNFDLYIEPLTALVAIKREEAKILGFKVHPYDALLDLYEPGSTVAELDVLFNDVRNQLVPFLREIRKMDQINNDFLHQHFDENKQWDFGLDVLKKMGYDFDKGRQDIAPHPFTINFSSQDVRVTTRIDENDFSNMCWSCIHEGGHALYEQGIPPEEYGLPTGSSASLGIHESQSRLWENHVGRSKNYWKYHYPKLQKIFPENLSDITLDRFYDAINKVEANFIRTEADELNYHFHVMIRYELEKMLLNNEIEVSELKHFWNSKYKEYLDVDVLDDNTGILQDIHWGHGSFGYFPTYSIGSFYAAQFFEKAVSDIENLEKNIANGQTDELLHWLRENIHKHGRRYEASELCERITGEKLNFKFFMNYAEKKYKEIYKMN